LNKHIPADPAGRNSGKTRNPSAFSGVSRGV
jgi:hypothetical protein